MSSFCEQGLGVSVLWRGGGRWRQDSGKEVLNRRRQGGGTMTFGEISPMALTATVSAPGRAGQDWEEMRQGCGAGALGVLSQLSAISLHPTEQGYSILPDQTWALFQSRCLLPPTQYGIPRPPSCCLAQTPTDLSSTASSAYPQLGHWGRGCSGEGEPDSSGACPRQIAWVWRGQGICHKCDTSPRKLLIRGQEAKVACK